MACIITPDFSYSASGKTVKFTNKTKMSGCWPKEYYWVFNNDDEEFISNPSYTFPAYDRSYQVKLRVTATDGTKKEITKTIRTGSSGGGGGSTTLVCSTSANFTYRVSGKTITFTDTSTTDKKAGTGTCSIRSRRWNLGSGVASTQRTCSRTFPSYNREYPIILQVTDSSGRSRSVSKTVKTGSSSGSGGGGGTTPSSDWTTETREIASGADHTIRVSHGNYDMLTMKIRVATNGDVTCLSVDDSRSNCNRKAAPGITISGSTVTAWMKTSSGGGTPGGGGTGLSDPLYLDWVDGKGGLDNITTRDIMELRDDIIGIEEIGFEATTQQVMQCRDALLGL